jgi:hypothetical protein
VLLRFQELPRKTQLNNHQIFHVTIYQNMHKSKSSTGNHTTLR